MSDFVLFDDNARVQLLPFTFTRPVADIRIGILTIREKWEKYLDGKSGTLTENYLAKKFPLHAGPGEHLLINGSVLPGASLVKIVQGLKKGESLFHNDTLIAAFTSLDVILERKAEKLTRLNWQHELHRISRPWHVFSMNDRALRADFELLTFGRKSASLPGSNKYISGEDIFLEEGAKVECSILNASTGPVYLGKNSEVMEGSIVRGPFSLGEHSTLKLGAKIYGATTIGPHCKVGGEVNNSVIFGFSNKAHDGFLGNAVLGEWVNIGADSNNSNLKNNYADVKIWSYESGRFESTGSIFCGLMMGDHSKCGINTMFNTGTVVGVSANIFGSGFPRNFINSFSWGGAAGISVYKLKDALDTAQRVMERRSIKLTQDDKDILEHIYNQDHPLV